MCICVYYVTIILSPILGYYLLKMYSCFSDWDYYISYLSQLCVISRVSKHINIYKIFLKEIKKREPYVIAGDISQVSFRSLNFMLVLVLQLTLELLVNQPQFLCCS